MCISCVCGALGYIALDTVPQITAACANLHMKVAKSMSDPKELEARRSAIRLPVRTIAAETGLDEHTVGRALGRASRGRDVLTSSMKKVENTIARHERDQLEHLRGLHPGTAAAE